MMWEVTFLCIGLYCGDGSDLGWFGNARFTSQQKCKTFAELVVERAIPLKGMQTKYTCIRNRIDDI